MPPNAAVYEHFCRTELLYPKQIWVENTLRTLTGNPPIQVTCKTLRFKLLASNFRETLHATTQTCFPEDVHDKHNSVLTGPIAVQIVDISDMGTSLMEQLERIEMGERGESKKGHVITRIVEDEGVGEGSAPAATALQKAAEARAKAGGPHKLLLEDAAGRRAYGLEIKPIEGVSTAMAMGAKFLLQNVKVARGVLLIEPSNTKLLGGKVEDLNKDFTAQRKQALQAGIDALKANNPRRTGT